MTLDIVTQSLCHRRLGRHCHRRAPNQPRAHEIRDAQSQLFWDEFHMGVLMFSGPQQSQLP
jgi:hypothetical protein